MWTARAWWVLVTVAWLGCGRSLPLVPGHVRDGGSHDGGAHDGGPDPTQRCIFMVEGDGQFGPVNPDQLVQRTITVTNVGEASCHLAEFTLAGDSGFSLADDPTPQLRELKPSQSASVTVNFEAPAQLPLDRVGELAIFFLESEGSIQMELRARLQLCRLVVAPDPFDFGNVTLNTTVTHELSFTNVGSIACHVKNVGLVAASDPGFTLPMQALAFTVQPGVTTPVQVRVTFTGYTSAPPHLRQGAVSFFSDDLERPNATVPLSAFINTVCTQAGQYIYTVDTSSMFSRFDPVTLSWVDIARLNCPSMASPYSMNVDQQGIAWVLYSDGHLFRVDTASAACTATSFVPGQAGLQVFGMGSTFDSATGLDTLYLAGGQQPGPGRPSLQSTLATLAFPSLLVSPVGTVTIGSPELAGTGDGQLWGYVTDFYSATGQKVFARLDRATGATLESYDLSAVTSSGGFAVKFFGGAFYIFVGADVWKLPRTSLVPGRPTPTSPPVRVVSSGVRDVVGAGVSTCAPVQ